MSSNMSPAIRAGDFFTLDELLVAIIGAAHHVFYILDLNTTLFGHLRVALSLNRIDRNCT